MSKYQIMPDMTPEQFEELKEDIRRRGVLIPIEFDAQGNILDGHHRYRAFTELIEEGADIPLYDKIVRKFATEDEKVAYVVSLNVKRRHLNAEQRQELVVRLRKEFGYTLSKIAQTLGISIATASRDIDALPAAERAELKSLAIQGADGRSYSANYAPRIFTTGTQQLRTMQNQIIDELSADLAKRYFEEAIKTNGEAPAPEAVTLPPVTPDARERMLAFAWYGGKGSHLDWLLPLLPRTKHFIDVFGGSAAVLLNREPSQIDTYNDLDKNVVNFFRVLRTPADYEELVRLLHLTPYSREDRKEAQRALREPPDPSAPPNVEMARKFFIMARQTRMGQVQLLSDDALNAWRFSVYVSQKGMASYTAQWQNGIDGLAAIAARLRNVQVECYPALDIIRLYNDPGVLLYCDPPYVHTSRRSDKTSIYSYEMTDAEHRALAVALHAHRGLVALSGYPSPLYDELYADWNYIDVPYDSAASNSAVSTTDSDRIERLWANYSLKATNVISAPSQLSPTQEDGSIPVETSQT